MPPRKKYKIEDLKQIANEKGGECLSSSVNTTKDYILWRCENNHEWESQLKNILEGRWCPECAINMQRHTIEKCYKLAEKKKGKCLSSKYINTDTKLEWECEHDHRWTATPSKIRQGRWCPYCAGRHKSIEYYQKLAKSHGGKCLSENYIAPHSPLLWQCKEGHSWEARPNNVKFGTWCPFCAGQRQTIEDMHSIAKGRGGKCLSEKYIKQNAKLLWECKDGHQWKAVANSIKNGSWCPKCRINYGEEIVRSYFETVFEVEFKNIRPKWLGGLELDGYNDTLKIAFEHQGKQHYKFIKHFQKNNKNFELQQKRDQKKRDLCSAHGVILIEIPQVPDLISLHELPGFLDSEIKEKQIQVTKAFHEVEIDLTKIYSQSQLEKLQTIAKANGGKLLSNGYKGDRRKLNWQCQNKHTWQATPNAIKTGTWCPQCYGNIKKDIVEIRELASRKGFILLSTEYKGTNKRLSWQCKFGHTWQTTPRHIANGTGCPKCTGNFLQLSDIVQYAQEHNILVLSKKYKNNLQKLEFTCQFGHNFKMPWTHLKKYGSKSCPECRKIIRSKNRRDKMHERLVAVITTKYGELLSPNYIDAKTKIHVRCTKGHEWWATSSSIIEGSWCRRCTNKTVGLKQRDTIENMQSIATLRGGFCLSEEYKTTQGKLEWRCAKGHQWCATPANIKKGRWCPDCARRRRLTIEEMHSLATSKGGHCLSTEYVNVSSKLKWECSVGHVWMARPEMIKGTPGKPGTWCPKCAIIQRSHARKR